MVLILYVQKDKLGVTLQVSLPGLLAAKRLTPFLWWLAGWRPEPPARQPPRIACEAPLALMSPEELQLEISCCHYRGDGGWVQPVVGGVGESAGRIVGKNRTILAMLP